MQDIERIAQEAFDSSKSAHRRIDSLEHEVGDLRDLTVAVKNMGTNVERLKKDGYNAFVVEVNSSENSDRQSNTLKSVEEIAKEVISGKWGNGQERVDRLTAAGYNASEVQSTVNEML